VTTAAGSLIARLRQTGATLTCSRDGRVHFAAPVPADLLTQARHGYQHVERVNIVQLAVRDMDKARNVGSLATLATPRTNSPREEFRQKDIIRSAPLGPALGVIEFPHNIKGTDCGSLSKVS
jgi:hypothetical protein